MRKLTVILVLALGVFWAAAAVAAPIKIGLMAPKTGAFASEGADMQKLVGLLAEEVNKGGGINGAMVELEVEDDQSEARGAANAARMLTAKGVCAVVGTYGSAVTQASQRIYDAAGIVQIATGSTAIALTDRGMKRFFRTCPRDDEQAKVIAAAIKNGRYKKVAILHDNSAYAKGLATESQSAIKGGAIADIVFFDALQPNERDYTAILTKLKGVKPDLLLFTGYFPEAGMLLRQMEEMKWAVPMLGGDATNNTDLVAIAGKTAAKGYRFVTPPLPADIDTDTAKAFLAAYKEKYHSLPSSIWPVLAGDAFNVIVAAIKAKGADSAAIADYLHNDLRDYEGLSGKISFDKKGDRVGDVYRLYEVDGEGRFILQP